MIEVLVKNILSLTYDEKYKYAIIKFHKNNLTYNNLLKIKQIFDEILPTPPSTLIVDLSKNHTTLSETIRKLFQYIIHPYKIKTFIIIVHSFYHQIKQILIPSIKPNSTKIKILTNLDKAIALIKNKSLKQ